MPDDLSTSNALEGPFEKVLTQLLEAEERGDSFDLSRVIRENPELETPLRQFFRNRDGFDRLAGDLAPLAPQPGTSHFTPTLSPGSQFGDYEILGELGRGGMGIVYKARQRSLKRFVAIKLILAGQLATKEEVKRFYRGARAAAKLDHPNIVPIYEVAQHQNQHYFTMKLIEGNNLVPYLPQFRDKPRVAAHLLSKIARAVHHAHECGILHRDLKPANILIDRAKQPHVTDFGLAKQQDESVDVSRTGDIIGTASYMSPEQAAGKNQELSEASDVYSLGAIFYEMMTGRPPFRAGTVFETLRQVVEKDPLGPRILNSSIHRDLETICLKCLDKRPERRYKSALSLAQDLERWLNGRPINARPVGRIERTWLWCRRKPVVAGLITLGVVLMATVGILAILNYSKMEDIRSAQLATQMAETEKLSQERKAKEAESGKLRQEIIAKEADEERKRQKALADDREKKRQEAERLRERADEDLRRLKMAEPAKDPKENLPVEVGPKKSAGQAVKTEAHTAYVMAMRRAALLAEREQTDALRELLETFNHEPSKRDDRRWEWYFLWALSQRQQKAPDRMRWKRQIQNLPVNTGFEAPVSWSQNSKRLAALDVHGDIKILDTANGNEITTLHNKALSNDEIAYRSGQILLSPDGQKLAQIIMTEPVVRIWDATKGTVIQDRGVSLPSDPQYRWAGDNASWSPDGRYLFLRSGGKDCHLWQVNNGKEKVLRGHRDFVYAVSWSSDGKRLVSGSGDGTIRIWDLDSSEEVRRPLVFGKPVISVACSPNSRLLAAIAGSVLSVWDLNDRKEIWSFPYPVLSNQRFQLSWTLNSRLLIVHAGIGASPHKLFEGTTGSDISTTDAAAAYSPEGSVVAYFSNRGLPLQQAKDSGLRLINPKTGGEIRRVNRAPVGQITWNPNGNCLAISTFPGEVQLWDVANSAEKQSIFSLRDTSTFLWSPDSLRFAALGKRNMIDRTPLVQIGSVIPGRPTLVLAGTGQTAPGGAGWLGRSNVFKMAISRDGKRLATAYGPKGEIDLWDVQSGKNTWRLPGHIKQSTGLNQNQALESLDWSPNGRWLASSAEDGTIKVWDSVTGVEQIGSDIGEFLYGGGSTKLAWSEDSTRLAAGGRMQRLLRVWNIPSGKVVKVLEAGGEPLAFSPDGRQVAVGGMNNAAAGEVKFWDIESKSVVRSLLSNEDHCSPELLSWSPDGHFLLFTTGGTRVWNLKTGSSVDIPGGAKEVAWDPENKRFLLLKREQGWEIIKSFDAASGKEIKNYGDAPGLAGCETKLLWTQAGPEVVFAHQIKLTPKGPRITIRVSRHGIGEASADQGMVELVKLDTGKSRFTANPFAPASPTAPVSPVCAIAWKPDGAELATVHEGEMVNTGMLKTWNSITGLELRQYSVDSSIFARFASGPYPSKESLVWSQDGKSVAYARNDAVQIWSLLEGGKHRAIRIGADASVNLRIWSMAWSPDSRRLGALANHGRKAVVKVWETATGKEIYSWDIDGAAPLEAAGLLAWHPGSNRLAGGTRSVHVWDTKDGQEVLELPGHTMPITRLEWSPDGQRIISLASKKEKDKLLAQELMVWDADTGNQILTLHGPDAGFQLSPNKEWLASSPSEDGLINLQRIATRKGRN